MLDYHFFAFMPTIKCLRQNHEGLATESKSFKSEQIKQDALVALRA